MRSHTRHCIRCGICCAATLAVFHIYELAQVLHRHADDAGFWDVWFELHDPSVANRWRQFVSLSPKAGSRAGCPRAVREEMERLPADVKRWLATYSWSPIAGLFRPNKDELWLHWALLAIGARPRGCGCAAGFCPNDCPARSARRTFQKSQITWRMRMRSRASLSEVSCVAPFASRASAAANVMERECGGSAPGWSSDRNTGASWLPKASSTSECSSSSSSTISIC